MKKSKITRFYLLIAIATFAAIMTVIIQKSYNNLMGPLRTAQSNNLIKPISPELNTELIEMIETKKEYSPQDINGPDRADAVSSVPTQAPSTSL